MDKHEQQVQRGEEAQLILTSAVWQAAFNDTRQALLEAIAGLDDLDNRQAPELHRMVRCLEKVKRALETHVATGKLAHKEIESRQRLFQFRR